MPKYICTIKDESVLETLENIGKITWLSTIEILIIDTNVPKSEIQKVDGILTVGEDCHVYLAQLEEN